MVDPEVPGGSGTEDLAEELKKRIADKVRDNLSSMGDYVTAGPPSIGPAYPSFKRPIASITVDILDTGMVLQYPFPVKRKIKVPGRLGGFNLGGDPSFQLFMEGLLQTIDVGSGDEDWNKTKRSDKIRSMMEKITAMGAPKVVERYVVETRSIACKDEQDLGKAIEQARQASHLIKQLRDTGELQQYGGCFGVPGEVIDGPDYSLGA